MEQPTVQSPVLLYTEQTPNPESLKYVTNRMLYPHKTADFRDEAAAKEWSALAAALFELPYVKGVYLCNNFVTITKEFNYDWTEIMLPIKEFLKAYIEAGKPIISEGFEEAKIAAEKKDVLDVAGDDAPIVQKIKDLIDTYVRPAVEMDGGNIAFKSYNDGVVGVILQGSCSGCPSSTVTLKSGIEGMLKRMVPEVKEVVAEMG
jgi:Fe-S cluster biogenesis protein NfuA